jgi:hypothetical protein
MSFGEVAVGSIGEICNAVIDYKYLLNRGYSVKSSIQIVTARYQLNKLQYAVLYRCIHPDSEAYSIRGKIVSVENVEEAYLLIDGYNVLITVDSGVMGEPVFIGDDMLLRDIRKSYRKFKYDHESHGKLIDLILKYVVELKPRHVSIILDEQISYSGELASAFRDRIKEYNILGDAYTAKKTDTLLSEAVGDTVVASSDIVVVRKASRIFDLARYIIEKEKPESIVDIVNKCLKHTSYPIASRIFEENNK